MTFSDHINDDFVQETNTKPQTKKIIYTTYTIYLLYTIYDFSLIRGTNICAFRAFRKKASVVTFSTYTYMCLQSRKFRSARKGKSLRHFQGENCIHLRVEKNSASPAR